MRCMGMDLGRPLLVAKPPFIMPLFYGSYGHQAELEFFKFSAAKEPSKLICQETTSGLPQHPATYEVLQHGAPRPCGA
jgi:hypothetical protein